MALNYILADNQDITRIGITHLLSVYFSNIHLEFAKNKGELISHLLINPRSLVVLDYTLFDFTSLDELMVVQQRFENMNWLFFSEELSVDFIQSLPLTNKSFSIIMKNSSEEEIIACIKSLCEGEHYICNYISNLLLNAKAESNHKHENSPNNLLSITEKNILKEIALGKTTKEIATDKNLSFHTINTHRKNIFRKLNVNNVHEATKYAIKAGIVDLVEYYI